MVWSCLTMRRTQRAQESATEPPFQTSYGTRSGTASTGTLVSGEPSFASVSKYASPSGWPSFTVLEPAHIGEQRESTLGMVRTEVRPAHGDSHLGHVFDDWASRRGGLRYCINSAAMRSIPVEDFEREGCGRVSST